MNKLLLGIIASTSIIHAHTLDIVYLETISLNELTPIHKQHNRAVYANEDRSLYYKIWNPNYHRSSLFIKALDAGLFKKIASLIGIIYDKQNRCRGYITTGGVLSLSNTEKSGLKMTPLRYVLPTEQQTNKPYITFYKRLVKNTAKSRYAFIDLSPTNIIEIEDQFYLIDLESVEPLSNLRKNFENHPEYSFHIKEYVQDVRALLNK